MNAQSNGQGPDEQASARASEHEQPRSQAEPAASTDEPVPAKPAEVAGDQQREFDWRLMASKRLEDAPAPEPGWRLEGGETSHEPAPAHEDVAEPARASAAQPEVAPPVAEPAYDGETPSEPAWAQEQIAEEQPAEEQPAEKPRRRLLLPLAAVLGLGLIGGGAYLVLTNGGLPDPFTPPVDSNGSSLTAEKPLERAVAANSESVKSDAVPDAVRPDGAKASDGDPPSEADSSAAKPDVEAKPEAEAVAPAPPAAKDAGSERSAENVEPAPPAASEAPVAKDADHPEENAAPARESASPLAAAEAGQSASMRALIEQLTETRTKLVEAQAQASQAQDQSSRNQAQLIEAQAQLAALTQRLVAAEARIEAKAETRAPAAPDLAPARSAEAAARLAVAQQTLAAFRHDGDAAPLVAALASMGADPAGVEHMRAGLSAPGVAALTAEFAKLAPQIVDAAAPAPAPAQQPAGSDLQRFGERALTFLQSRVEKMVRVRPAGSAEPGGSAMDQAARQVATALKLLRAGDLAGAVAEEGRLPEPARAVAADWAKAANDRLAAEVAAKAEVEAALVGLTKAKN
jgi:hypothetical protein